MTAKASPPATGPIILEHVKAIEEIEESIVERLDNHDRKLDQIQAQQAALSNALVELNRQLHQFLDPAMDIQGWLKMMKESYRRQVDALHEVEQAVRNEHTKTRKALEIHMSDPGRELSRGS